MPIVIHVGTHKTGTTSLQRFASANRAELRDKGLWYPSYEEIGLFGHYAHHHLAFSISENDDKKLSESEARNFVEYIDQNRQKDETVLISAEPLYRLIIAGERRIHRWRSASSAYWNARDEFLARLRELFPFDDAEILICLRRQDSFARSVYQERVKVTKFCDKFETFLHKDRSIFDYLGQVNLLAKHFPAVRVVTFESLIKDGDLHSAFFELLGIDITFKKERPVVNTSLPIELVEFKRLLNQTDISPDDAKAIGNELTKVTARGDWDSIPDLDWLPEEELSAFQGSFERDNEVLRQQYAPDYPSPLFSPAGRTNTVQFTGLSGERIMQIGHRFMRSGS